MVLPSVGSQLSAGREHGCLLDATLDVRKALDLVGGSGSLRVVLTAIKLMRPEVRETFLALDHPLIQDAMKTPLDKAGLVDVLQGAFPTELAALVVGV